MRIKNEDIDLKKKIFYETVVYDIHGLFPNEAKTRIENLIKLCTNEVKRIEIIHGFNGGNELAKTVKENVKSKRIKRKYVDATNQGRTFILLRPR